MSCTYYEFKSGLFIGDFWCQKKDCRVDDDTYYKYCRGYSYSDCPIYKHTESSGCFITTIVCQILERADDDKLLNNLRNFRDNILQNDEKYHDLLKDYDNIGPKLADCILNDKDKKEMATGLYHDIIIPINNLIEKKDYDKACCQYNIMTLALINYYGLKHEYNTAKDNDYGYQNFEPQISGHGKRKLKKQS